MPASTRRVARLGFPRSPAGHSAQCGRGGASSAGCSKQRSPYPNTSRSCQRPVSTFKHIRDNQVQIARFSASKTNPYRHCADSDSLAESPKRSKGNKQSSTVHPPVVPIASPITQDLGAQPSRTSPAEQFNRYPRSAIDQESEIHGHVTRADPTCRRLWPTDLLTFSFPPGTSVGATRLRRRQPVDNRSPGERRGHAEERADRDNRRSVAPRRGVSFSVDSYDGDRVIVSSYGDSRPITFSFFQSATTS